MKKVYSNLSEKDKRLYAAVEALKLPHGGIRYISELLGCDRKTIQRGIKELKNPRMIQKKQIRKKGGGRKAKIKTIANIDEIFLRIIKEHTAGDPMNEEIKWTNLTLKQLIEKLNFEDIFVGRSIVKQLLKKHSFVKRKAQKKESIGSCKNRNEQFEKIAMLKDNTFAKIAVDGRLCYDRI